MGIEMGIKKAPVGAGRFRGRPLPPMSQFGGAKSSPRFHGRESFAPLPTTMLSEEPRCPEGSHGPPTRHGEEAPNGFRAIGGQRGEPPPPVACGGNLPPFQTERSSFCWPF